MAKVTLEFSGNDTFIVVRVDEEEKTRGKGYEITKWLGERGIPLGKALFEVGRAQSMGHAIFEADLIQNVPIGHP